MARFNTEAMSQSFQDAATSRRSAESTTEPKKAAPKRPAAGTTPPRPRRRRADSAATASAPVDQAQTSNANGHTSPKETPKARAKPADQAQTATGPAEAPRPRAEQLARRGEKELTLRLPNRLLTSMTELQFRVFEQDGALPQRERIVADALAALPKDDAKTLALARKVPRGSGDLSKVALTLPAAAVERAQQLAYGSVLPDNGGVKVTVTAIVTAALEGYLPKARKKVGL